MAKDAKGHGSDARGGPVKISVDPSKIGYRIADIGPGGREHNVTYGGDAAAAASLDTGHPKSAPVEAHPSMALNAWGQTPSTARAVRKQLRQARAQRAYSKGR